MHVWRGDQPLILNRFYLRARGLGLETAKQMLIHAFAGESIDRVKCEAAREEIDRLIWDRLEENPLLAGMK
jgi:Fe-S cluster assembly scaffold protein SufB